LLGTLAAHDIHKSHGSQAVLRGVSLTVRPGDRIGVVGPNGIGKTTLLRILAGLEAPDAGSVRRSPPALEVGYLAQVPDPRPSETLLELLARQTGVAVAERDFEARARTACADAGLRLTLDTQLEALSGGEAARVALASLLLSRFDVYLLDEPTNSLDARGLDRLDRFVERLRGGLVVVSHDRAFLDRTVNRILEFEAETGKTREFAGAWTEYEEARERERSRHEAAYADYDAERRRFERLLGVRRTQARSAGATADRRGTNALRSKVRQAERRLDRLERVDKPWSPWRLQLDFGHGPRGGDVAVALAGAVVEHPGFRLGPIDLEVRAGERLLVEGDNGSGKTTLVRALLGAQPLAAGRRIVGPETIVGEIDQRRAQFELAVPLAEPFAASVGLPVGTARTLLAAFGLGADELSRPARSLSPGEKTRASLAAAAARSVNCLVLDEPTNHLDLEAIEELESALERFAGAILLVSHDRRFVERFRATGAVQL
jgi:ATPase subunit of ABC transporter with duplicated ATPase domains